MSPKRVTKPSRRALAGALIFATASLVVGTTASCTETPCGDGPCGEAPRGEAPCAEGTTVCDRLGQGRACQGGAWVVFFDGPCAPAPRSPPDAEVDARAPDGGPGDAAGDARDGAAADAADAGDCPADLGAAVGAPCPREGQFCGSCANPCQFCNVLRCELGRWGRIEVPPAPCDAGDGG